MFFSKTPDIVKQYYKGLIWHIPDSEKTIYLTFDDGPTENITSGVLGLLGQYNAKATFFCIGKNVKRNPEIFERILKEGHVVGNHSYNHLKGWKTKNSLYFRDIIKCHSIVNSNLLRPPYGKIKKSQIKPLLLKYKIVMWDVLSGDYDNRISPERCLQNVLDQTEAGSIVVFHDSMKAKKNLEYALPRVLEYFHNQGFNFKSISHQ